MKISNLIQILCSIPTILVGTIVEVEHFEDVLTYVEQAFPYKIIVVCDLDNTLIVPKEPLGSVAWAEYFIKTLEEKGLPKKDSEIVEHILWRTFQPHIEMQTVDPKTNEVIEELKKRNIPLLGLTARFPDDAWFTFLQLESVDIDLSLQKDLPQFNFELALEPKASYQRGILFSTTTNKKSAVLMKFLELHQMGFEYVIFIDDKLQHVMDVETTCKNHGIECLGIRFSGADKYFKTFNPAQAKLQWDVFPKKIEK